MFGSKARRIRFEEERSFLMEVGRRPVEGLTLEDVRLFTAAVRNWEYNFQLPPKTRERLTEL